MHLVRWLPPAEIIRRIDRWLRENPEAADQPRVQEHYGSIRAAAVRALEQGVPYGDDVDPDEAS
jgi:hypothetical protein